jgi:DNA-binding TFAR19-related protein (PDSD5 family)
MDEHLEITRGNDATLLLGNSLLNEALDAIEKRYENSWKSSGLSQIKLREEAFRMLCTVEEFRKHLTNFVNTGKLASVAQTDRIDQQIRERDLAEWDGSPDGPA